MTDAANTTAALALQPAVAEALDKWHAMIAAGDLSGLPALLHPQAVFRSPMAFKPYLGAPLVSLILGTVVKVFEDFHYHRQLVGADGLDVVLEFATKVAGRELKGIDMIRFDAQGKIVEFEVMIRPMSGLQVLGDEMARRLAPLLSGQAS
jgi:hypothetical protein